MPRVIPLRSSSIEPVGHVDPLGYLWCRQCKELPPESPGMVTRCYTDGSMDRAVCEGCGALFLDERDPDFDRMMAEVE